MSRNPIPCRLNLRRFALAGKIDGELKEIIRERPPLFAALIRQLRNAPDPAVEQVVRETAAPEYGVPTERPL